VLLSQDIFRSSASTILVIAFLCWQNSQFIINSSAIIRQDFSCASVLHWRYGAEPFRLPGSFQHFFVAVPGLLLTLL